MGNITVKVSFNMGDLISEMAGIRKLCLEQGKKAIIYHRLNLPVAQHFPNMVHPTTDENGVMVCMNFNMFNMLKPLIEAQDYIERYEIYDGQHIDYNLEKTRLFGLLPIPAGDIRTWSWFTYPEMACDLSEAWMDAPDGNTTKRYINGEVKNMIIVSRTERYVNPYITFNFLKKYQHDLLFAGTKREYEIYCAQWELDIPYLSIIDFLQLGKELKHCKFFIGNQSFPFHIADAMKVPRILEYCREFPNSPPHGKNGYSFLTQDGLEYYFNLLNK